MIVTHVYDEEMDATLVTVSSNVFHKNGKFMCHRAYSSYVSSFDPWESGKVARHISYCRRFLRNWIKSKRKVEGFGNMRLKR